MKEYKERLHMSTATEIKGRVMIVDGMALLFRAFMLPLMVDISARPAPGCRRMRCMDFCSIFSTR